MKNKKNTIKNEKDWYRLKKYPHIGLQYDSSDRGWINSYVKDKNVIEKHAFFPFIHRELKVRKFRREVCHDGTRSKLRKPSEKIRDIYYANHLDSNIYSYYASLLSSEYNKRLDERGINECVTAYRRIRVDPTDLDSRNKCNIDFAWDVFSYIKESQKNNLVAIAFDIKGFFDNLNHKKLKKYWKEVIESGNSLPNHHYNVFRNITKFSYVEEDDLFHEFKDEILVERKPNIIKNIAVKKKQYLKNKRAVAYCLKDKIKRLRNKNLIKANKYFYDDKNKIKKGLRDKGIPQGSPISAVLANIYMLDFDKAANDFLKAKGGIYRRYSDDMVAICEVGFEKEVIDFFMKTIVNYCLEIQPAKTQVFHFKYDKKKSRYFCFEKNLNTKVLHENKNFEYLGFQFDGFYTLLKKF